MSKSLTILGAIGAIALASAPVARADAELEILVGSTVLANLYGVGTSGTLGSGATYSQGGWNISYVQGVWNPLNAYPNLDLGSYLTSAGGGVLTILFSDNNNPSAAGETSLLLQSGIISGNLTGTLTTYWGPGNNLLATNGNGGLLLNTLPLGTTGSSTVLIPGAGNYSLTEALQITSGTGSISSDDEVLVPDGGKTLVMLGLGFCGLGMFRSWFGKKKVSLVAVKTDFNNNSKK